MGAFCLRLSTELKSKMRYDRNCGVSSITDIYSRSFSLGLAGWQCSSTSARPILTNEVPTYSCSCSALVLVKLYSFVVVLYLGLSAPTRRPELLEEDKLKILLPVITLMRVGCKILLLSGGCWRPKLACGRVIK